MAAQPINVVKSKLLELVDEMNRAGNQGIKFEFNIVTDPITLQSTLGRFEAFSRVKLEN